MFILQSNIICYVINYLHNSYQFNPCRPYDNRWSKTMIGYGPEDTHFVIELTYNYGVDDYKLGNDFLGITLKSSKVLENAKSLSWPVEVEDNKSYVVAPGGYKFYVIDEPQPVDKGMHIKHF